MLIQTISVTPDQRYAVISSSPGAGGNALSIIDLKSPDWNLRPIVSNYTHNWVVIGNSGTRFFLATDEGAELGKVVTTDLSAPELEFSDLIKEQENRTLIDVVLLGGHLLITYLTDAKSETARHNLDGTSDGAIELPGIGLVSGFRGCPNDDEAFFLFTGYNAPTTIYRYEIAQRDLSVWAKPEVPIDLDRITVEQHFYNSKDGTRIPMLVVRRADVQPPAPTILYGYGGFGISMVPYYSPAILAWVEAGGIYAIANLRGGGEYGKAWHNTGRLKNKQNVFDDFICAAEYLRRESISATNGLAIQGESNGGLLVGAVLNQRPDLFSVALAGVGVMDMIRFGRFTNGQFWIGEYGDPEDETDFHNVLSYSPYHTIRPGRCYPAVLVTTADTDDRAVPAHSFKYLAALQAADSGDKPIILRVDTRVGHGAGKPVAKQIDEVADQWAFAAHWVGLVTPTDHDSAHEPQRIKQ